LKGENNLRAKSQKARKTGPPQRRKEGDKDGPIGDKDGPIGDKDGPIGDKDGGSTKRTTAKKKSAKKRSK
jgi:hypothetical protein